MLVVAVAVVVGKEAAENLGRVVRRGWSGSEDDVVVIVLTANIVVAAVAGI